MQQIICPIDKKPCDPACPDRFTDRPEGGCLMTEAQAHGALVLPQPNGTALIVFGAGQQPGKRPGKRPRR